MSVYDAAFVNSELSKNTSIFGLKLWVVIGIFVGAVFVLILFLLSLCITASRRRTTTQKGKLHRPINSELTPVVSKEIQEIVHHDPAPDHRPIVPQVRFSSSNDPNFYFEIFSYMLWFLSFSWFLC